MRLLVLMLFNLNSLKSVCLTSRRNDNRILNTNYMEHLWLYCQHCLEESLDIETFVKWKEFADICYGQKRPEDLKVAFFCGNEPENDVKHLMKQKVVLPPQM